MQFKRSSSRAMVLQFSRVIPPRWMAGVVWSISACFALLQFAMQLSSSSLINSLMVSFHLGAFGGALLLSSYYYMYALFQVPAGILIDRYGPRRLLTISAIVCVLASYLFASAHNVWIAFIGRIVLGGSFAFAFVGSLALISRWFPARLFSLIVSIAETMGMLGSALGGVFLVSVVHHFGWRGAAYGFGMAAALLSVFLWIFVRDAPLTYMRRRSRLNLDFKVIMVALGQALRRPIVWLNGLYSGLMFSVVNVFVGLWALNFFIVSDHMAPLQASLVANMAFIGVALGCPVISYIDSIGCYRRHILMICPILCLLIFSLVLFVVMPAVLVGGLMFILGVVCSSYMIPFTIANDLSSVNNKAAMIGFINTLSVCAAPIFQPMVGFFLHVCHHSTSKAYTSNDYHYALSVLLAVYLLAFFIACILSKLLQDSKPCSL